MDRLPVVHPDSATGKDAGEFAATDTSPQISGVVSWYWEIPTNTVLYSREWRDLLLRPDDEQVQNTLSAWWPHVHEDDVQPFLEAARDIAEGVTDAYRSMFRIQRADGQWIWLLSHGSVVEKDGGRPVKVRGVLMDITPLRSDLKFQHGNASMTEPRYYASPDTPSDIAALANRKPASRARVRTTATLPATPHIFYGFGDESFTGMDPEQRVFIQERVRQVFADGHAVRELVTFTTDYGHNIIGDFFFWPEFDGNGKVLAVTTQFCDTTDRILAERRARLNENRLDTLYRLTQMANAPEEEVLAFVMDSLIRLTDSLSGFLFFPRNPPGLRGRMVWSQTYYNILGPGELPADRLPEELMNLTRDGSGRPFQRIIRNGNNLQPVSSTFDGRIKALRYIVTPVFDDGRIVCIAGVRDKKNMEYREDDVLQLEAFVSQAWLILRRHEVFRELQRAKEAAEKANKVKDEFLANVSHELRTPLNGILSMLQLLEFLPLNEQQREYVRTAGASGKALLRIISDILDFARIESGKMKLQAEPFDLKGAVASSLSLFRQEADDRGLTFTVSIGEDIPFRLLGDDARVRQILFNIVGNALKFTDTGGITVTCSLLPHGGAEHAWIYLAVTDTGIGIAPEEQMRIFEAFTQIDSSSTRKFKGTGLGLSIVRSLVELMGGSVSLESEVGKGTTVHCSLRFDRLPDAQYAEESRAEQAEPEGRQLRILVAEDDAVSRFALRVFLERLGHLPVCAPNGRMALEMLQLHPFDCLFTDIQMPDMDGLELVERVRSGRLEQIQPSEEARQAIREVIPGEYETTVPVSRAIPVVSVSAHAMRGDKERFLEAGMDFYLSKPVIFRELAEVLQAVSQRVTKAGTASM